jgi:hypothetical protein
MEPSLKRDVSLFPDFFPVGRSDKILSKSSLANGFSSSREDWRPVTVRCSFPDGRGVPPAARYIQKKRKVLRRPGQHEAFDLGERQTRVGAPVRPRA